MFPQMASPASWGCTGFQWLTIDWSGVITQDERCWCTDEMLQVLLVTVQEGLTCSVPGNVILQDWVDSLWS